MASFSCAPSPSPTRGEGNNLGNLPQCGLDKEVVARFIGLPKAKAYQKAPNPKGRPFLGGEEGMDSPAGFWRDESALPPVNWAITFLFKRLFQLLENRGQYHKLVIDCCLIIWFLVIGYYLVIDIKRSLCCLRLGRRRGCRCRGRR